MTFWDRLKDDMDNQEHVLPAWFAFLIAAASVGCMYCGVTFCVGAAKDHDNDNNEHRNGPWGCDKDQHDEETGENFAHDNDGGSDDNDNDNDNNKTNTNFPTTKEKSVSFAMQDFAPVLAWFIQRREERKRLNGQTNVNATETKDFQYFLNLMNGGGIVEYMATWEIVFTFSGGAIVLGLLQTIDFELVVMLVTLLPLLAFVCGTLFFEGLFTLGAARPYHDGETLEAVSIFHDFHGSFVRQTSLGLGQVSLLVMYAWGLYESGLPDFSTRRVYGFYWAGVLLGISYVVGKNVRKNVIANEKRFWSKALSSFRDGKKLLVKDGLDQGKVITVNTFQIHVRFLLGMLVNTCGASLVILGLPLQLAGIGGKDALPDPMNLVLNAIAAFYIFEVDDLSQSITFEIVDGNVNDDGSIDASYNSNYDETGGGPHESSSRQQKHHHHQQQQKQQQQQQQQQQHDEESLETLQSEMKNLEARLNRALRSKTEDHMQNNRNQPSSSDINRVIRED